MLSYEVSKQPHICKVHNVYFQPTICSQPSLSQAGPTASDPFSSRCLCPLPLCHTHTSGSRFYFSSLLFLSLLILYPRLTVFSFIRIISSKTKSFLLMVINKRHLYLYRNRYGVPILTEVFGGAVSVQWSELKLSTYIGTVARWWEIWLQEWGPAGKLLAFFGSHMVYVQSLLMWLIINWCNILKAFASVIIFPNSSQFF